MVCVAMLLMSVYLCVISIHCFDTVGWEQEGYPAFSASLEGSLLGVQAAAG